MKAKTYFKILSIVIWSLIFVTVVTAAPGDLDLTFSGDGKVTTDFLNTGETAEAVVVQADGKILVAGYRYGGVFPDSYDITVARYLADGALDPNFGVNGKVITNLGPGFADTAQDMALQSDGKIIVVGGSRYDLATVRYTTAGMLDNTFGVGGVITTDVNQTSEQANAVAIQPDGKIVVAGSANDGIKPAIILVRYTTQGALDNGFGANGIVTTTFPEGGVSAQALALQSDGKIVAAGFGAGNFALARYTTSGALDSTFGAGGIVTASVGTGQEWYDVAIQPDGKILVAGFCFNESYAADFTVARFTPEGMLDNTFGVNGVARTDLGHMLDYGLALMLLSDGKIVVAGASGDYLTGNDFAMVRYTSAGTVDNTFGSNGIVFTDFGYWDYGHAAALQPDGKMIVAGRVSPNPASRMAYNNLLALPNDADFGVARYESGVSVCQPISEVEISGSMGNVGTIFIDTLYTFDAVVTPINATLPITYTWSPDPWDGQGTARAHYLWTTTGTKTVTVTVENCGASVFNSKTVHLVIPAAKIYLPLVLRK
ncbi:MAG TPA: delta-60 repeat domain-containing protein [Anaerolineae bacterium]|nr:delta-60 repeat domain-containing protein [Anaerolineae bacterium]HQK15759.1 delta-60 repeat domain-containing protein [Anaerolineae bacterium]